MYVAKYVVSVNVVSIHSYGPQGRNQMTENSSP